MNRQSNNGTVRGVTERGMNGRRTTERGDSLTARELLRKIQELAFRKVECELYLDAYPECTAALDYYRELAAKYKALTEQYESAVAPLRQENIEGEAWTWVDKPWPWQLDGNGREV